LQPRNSQDCAIRISQRTRNSQDRLPHRGRSSMDMGSYDTKWQVEENQPEDGSTCFGCAARLPPLQAHEKASSLFLNPTQCCKQAFFFFLLTGVSHVHETGHTLSMRDLSGSRPRYHTYSIEVVFHELLRECLPSD